VGEVWKRGYGDGTQLTWLYLALVRAAGFEAYGCWISNRAQYFFNPKTEQADKLNSNAVLVRLNGKNLYFDPGTAFAPFGMLDWAETATAGLKLDKDGGAWIKTEVPAPSQSQLLRTARLKISEAGDLEGTLTVTYTGLQAMGLRREMLDADDIERKTFLEDEAKRYVPVASELQLKNKGDWGATEAPLVAEFEMKVSAWASIAGQRVVFPVGLFGAGEKHVFDRTVRVHPIYTAYPYENIDDITLELPPEWRVESAPEKQSIDEHIVRYGFHVDDRQGTVHLVRNLSVDFTLLDSDYYQALRTFFQKVKTGDDQAIVLLRSPEPGSR
jgi:hypothetical protein